MQTHTRTASTSWPWPAAALVVIIAAAFAGMHLGHITISDVVATLLQPAMLAPAGVGLVALGVAIGRWIYAPAPFPTDAGDTHVALWGTQLDDEVIARGFDGIWDRRATATAPAAPAAPTTAAAAAPRPRVRAIGGTCPSPCATRDPS